MKIPYWTLETQDKQLFSAGRRESDNLFLFKDERVCCEEGSFRLLIRYSKKLDYGTKPLFLCGKRKAVGMRAHRRQWIPH